MGNFATYNDFGFVCPVKGCDKRKNRRFNSPVSTAMHISVYHPGELEKRLKIKKMKR